MPRPRILLVLLLTLALAMPALALPCAAMGWGSDLAMDDACPLMEAQKRAAQTGDDHCDGMAAPGTDGPGIDRALPECCIAPGGEPASMPSGVVVTTPQPPALQPTTDARVASTAIPAHRPAPAPSPPRSAPAPLFTLHASLLI